MTDLVSWLEAQIAEDERMSRREDVWDPYRPSNQPPDAYDVVIGGQVVSAARWLAECETKRAIIKAHPNRRTPWGLSWECLTCSEFGWIMDNGDYVRDGDDWPCLTLRLLAVPFADRPGYDETWRP
jgi:hypothetical protein